MNSWSFRKVGTQRDSLKASVQAEHAPQEVKDDLCRRIDDVISYTHTGSGGRENTLLAGTAILVETHGPATRLWLGVFRRIEPPLLRVVPIALIDTPDAEGLT